MRRNATLWIFRGGRGALATALAGCSTSGRDAAITSRVKTVLQADRVVDASKIQVSTEAGVVTLEGSVAGEPAHGKAIELAQNVEGVRQVRDRLSVTPAPPAPADAEPPASSMGRSAPPALGGMTVENRRRSRRPSSSQPGGSYGHAGGRRRTAGRRDSSRSGPESSVEPVSYREAVPAPELREAASASGPAAARVDEAIATTLPDSPVPLGPADADDAAITARVQAGLVDLGRSVQVLTRGGVVTLSGVVETELERSQALRIARATKGVARVEDRLVVLTT